MPIREVANGLIKACEVTDGPLNMMERAFRVYDPCFAYVTHCLPGQTLIAVDISDSRCKPSQMTGKEPGLRNTVIGVGNIL